MVEKINNFFRDIETFNSQMSTNDGKNMDGLLLGHPDLIRKYNIQLKEQELL